MSYAIGTPNFNLPQTQGGDKRDWADTNQAFADLDAAVKTAGDDSTLALSAAQTAQTTADGAVTTAQGAVTTANGASATAQTANETAQLANNAAQAAQSTADGAVTTANGAVTTANAAQTTASNADTVALRAEGKADAANGNIGTMSNLNTQDKTSLVAAINEVLSQIGGSNMTLDFNNVEKLLGNTAGVLNKTIAGNKSGALFITCKSNTTSGAHISINGVESATCVGTSDSIIPSIIYGVKGGDVITSDIALVADGVGRYVNFVPYAE